ncbi:hypothetical protein AB4072_09470 [Microvirga sp. 2MCAF38]|uniref:hypothetical protein n=1 Tax=Microvirga sp. 2MCAF38 TaxID=3232989 RepID=UPI003F98AB64
MWGHFRHALRRAGPRHLLFNTALNATSNVDQIVGFNVAEDRIELSRAIFGGFGAKVSLAIGDKANAAGPQIVYTTRRANCSTMWMARGFVHR